MITWKNESFYIKLDKLIKIILIIKDARFYYQNALDNITVAKIYNDALSYKYIL